MGLSKEKFIQHQQNQYDQMPDWMNEPERIPTSENTALPRLAMPTDLKRLSITKGSISQLAQMIIQHSQENDIPAYQMKAWAKYLELLAKEISDRVGDEATDELAKNGGEIGLAGMTLKKKSAAGKWDYKEIPEWVEKKKELEAIEATAQLAYSLMTKKKIGTGPQVVGEDGEIMIPAKWNPGKEIVEITIAK